MVYKQTKPQSHKVSLQKKGRSFQHCPLGKYPLWGALRHPDDQHQPFLSTKKSFDWRRLAQEERRAREPWVQLLGSQPQCCQRGVPSSTAQPSPASPGRRGLGERAPRRAGAGLPMPGPRGRSCGLLSLGETSLSSRGGRAWCCSQAPARPSEEEEVLG